MKVVAEPQKIVEVDSPEEVWWKRLVYRLPTDDGYDLIVHLVRVPPTPKWDVDWLDEPQPLAKVTVRASLGDGKLRDAWAVRPYDYEEEQQTVQTALPARVSKGAAEVTIPPFRYHTMVIFRVNAR